MSRVAAYYSEASQRWHMLALDGPRKGSVVARQWCAALIDCKPVGRFIHGELLDANWERDMMFRSADYGIEIVYSDAARKFLRVDNDQPVDDADGCFLFDRHVLALRPSRAGSLLTAHINPPVENCHD